MQIANRYMSEMHPVYYRSEKGVASSVGRELGAYEGAKEAREERKRDRDILGDIDLEGMERAAKEGIKDFGGFEGLEGMGGRSRKEMEPMEMEPMVMEEVEPMKVEMDVEEGQGSNEELDSVYAQILANKETVASTVFNAEISSKRR